MKPLIKDSIIFVVGSAIGAGISWFVTRRYYKAVADEEIESVKRSFLYLKDKAQKQADAAKNKPSIDIMAQALKLQKESKTNVEHSTLEASAEPNTNKVNYSNFSAEETEETEPEEEPDESEEEDAIPVVVTPEAKANGEPYVLNHSPNESEAPFYTSILLVYYSDGTYADTHGVEHEVEDYIGKKMMDYVENTKSDEIFIRNDELQIDLDIVKDARTYDEVMFG